MTNLKKLPPLLIERQLREKVTLLPPFSPHLGKALRESKLPKNLHLLEDPGFITKGQNNLYFGAAVLPFLECHHFGARVSADHNLWGELIKNELLIDSEELLFFKLQELSENSSVAFILDFSLFDPSIFSPSKIYEPGGVDFHFFLRLIKLLRVKKISSATICGIDPKRVLTEDELLFAAKVVKEVAIALQER